MNKRIVAGAHYGLRDWLVQRATAVIMALYSLLFLVVMLVVRPGSYEAWHSIFAHGLMKAASFLFLLSLCWHAWIGVRDIWMDYVKPLGLRLTLHVATASLLIVCAGWSAKILWGLSA